MCNIDEDVNRQIVENFRDHYGTAGRVFPCLYDPRDSSVGAVLQILTPGMHVFHATFWPGCALVMGIAVCFVLVKGNIFKEENDEAEHKLEETNVANEQHRSMIWV